MNKKAISKIKEILQNGHLKLGSYQLCWSVRKVFSQNKYFERAVEPGNLYKLHVGPGAKWEKPGSEWLTLDADPKRADILINFNDDFKTLPFQDNSVACIYGSHVFEHISIYTCPRFFKEFYRILTPGGYFRLVLPDARRSIELYLSGNTEFILFKRRSERAKQLYNLDYTLFECMKEDFLSCSGQSNLLGHYALAHQNAWDFETIVRDLCRAGFREEDIYKSDFRKTVCPDFEFEGSYPSEANEDYRSLYVEAKKKYPGNNIEEI